MSIEKQDFYFQFEQLRAQALPFVLFRLPQAKELILYQQETTEHFESTDLNMDGFVFAPFHKTAQHTYIPKQQKRIIKLPLGIKPQTAPLNTEEQFKNEYLELVAKAKETIRKTPLKKVVVSRTHRATLPGTAAEAFARLVEAYPNAMVYYWSHPHTGDWMGATPETLLSIRQNTLFTMALAGTLPYDSEAKPNWTAKEIEEQQMVVDFISDRLTHLFSHKEITSSATYTKQAGNLVHLCADFQVSLKDFKTIDLIRLLHPTPAVAGLPIDESMAFIRKNEQHKRSYYAGFLGPISQKDIRLFVNLRCAKVLSKQVRLHVGGGITAHSNPNDEWEESQRKAETLLHAL